MLLSARDAVYDTVKSKPFDSRRRTLRIKASYSLLPMLTAGRLALEFGFNGVGSSAEMMRGFERLPGMRWFTRGRVFRSRPSEYTKSALRTVSGVSSCDHPALVWI